MWAFGNRNPQNVGYENLESKLLLLDYAFSAGALRVELLTGVRNL
jgi:hypothetical protein